MAPSSSQSGAAALHLSLISLQLTVSAFTVLAPLLVIVFGVSHSDVFYRHAGSVCLWAPLYIVRGHFGGGAALGGFCSSSWFGRGLS